MEKYGPVQSLEKYGPVQSLKSCKLSVLSQIKKRAPSNPLGTAPAGASGPVHGAGCRCTGPGENWRPAARAPSKGRILHSLVPSRRSPCRLPPATCSPSRKDALQHDDAAHPDADFVRDRFVWKNRTFAAALRTCLFRRCHAHAQHGETVGVNSCDDDAPQTTTHAAATRRVKLRLRFVYSKHVMPALWELLLRIVDISLRL